MFPYCTNQPDNFETDRDWVRILFYLRRPLRGPACEALFICLKIALEAGQSSNCALYPATIPNRSRFGRKRLAA